MLLVSCDGKCVSYCGLLKGILVEHSLWFWKRAFGKVPNNLGWVHSGRKRKAVYSEETADAGKNQHRSFHGSFFRET